MTKETALEVIRPLGMALPDAVETVKWEHDTVFQVHEKMFAIVGEWRGALCLTVKVGKEAMGVFLRDERYFEAPYVGKHGWVSLRLDAPLDGEELGELIRGSYALVSGPKRRSRSPRAAR
jgi:predicted DNA-binding protein (MmcQ/YjbR family)